MIEIEKNANKNVIKILIGNKNDLEEKRFISFSQAKDFADSNGLKYVETSAKLNNNVTEAFSEIGKELMEASKDKEFFGNENKKTITISNNTTDINKENKVQKGCCAGNK